MYKVSIGPTALLDVSLETVQQYLSSIESSLSCHSKFWRSMFHIQFVKQCIISMTMNGTQVPNPRRKLDVFGSVIACANLLMCFRRSLTRFADFVSLLRH